MRESTRHALLAINETFYDEHAEDFGATRERPWPAWKVLLERSFPEPSTETLRVLDVGCGNGRFGALVAETVRRPLLYRGVDQSRGLLDQARERLSRGFERVELGPADLGDPTAPWLQSEGLQSEGLQSEGLGADERYDVVGLFGVLHHLPGERARRALLTRLGASLAPGGRLWASWWMLHRTERFEKKIVPWERLDEDRRPDVADLEPGDTLLSWQRDGFGLRYLHFPTDQELDRLRELDGLRFLGQLESDGPTGRENLYLEWTC